MAGNTLVAGGHSQRGTDVQGGEQAGVARVWRARRGKGRELAARRLEEGEGEGEGEGHSRESGDGIESSKGNGGDG